MWHGEIDRIARTIQRDHITEPEKDHRDHVGPFRALWTVTERTDDDDEEQGDVELEEDFEDVLACACTEEIEGVCAAGCSRGDQLLW